MATIANITFNDDSVSILSTFAKLVGKNPTQFSYDGNKLSMFSAPSNIYVVDDLKATVTGATAGANFSVPDITAISNIVVDGSVLLIDDERGVAIKRKKSNFKLPLASDGSVFVLSDAKKMFNDITSKLVEKNKIKLNRDLIKEFGLCQLQNSINAIISFSINEKIKVSIYDGSVNIHELGEVVYMSDLTTDDYVPSSEHIEFKGYLSGVVSNLVADNDEYLFLSSTDGKLNAIKNSTNGVNIYVALL